MVELCLAGGKPEAHASLKYIEVPDRRSGLGPDGPMQYQVPHQGWESALVVGGYLPLVWGAKANQVLEAD